MTKLLTTIFLLSTIVGCGQKKQSIDKDLERINVVCDKFMETFAIGKTVEAIELLKQNTVMTPASLDTIQATIIYQMNNLFPAYGRMLSPEFITERKIKDFIAKRFYILKFDKYYLKFDFTLYKSGSGWTVTNFKYDEELVELLY
jgi:hypothetical protein